MRNAMATDAHRNLVFCRIGIADHIRGYSEIGEARDCEERK
jgi:hypothetical protein